MLVIFFFREYFAMIVIFLYLLPCLFFVHKTDHPGDASSSFVHTENPGERSHDDCLLCSPAIYHMAPIKFNCSWEATRWMVMGLGVWVAQMCFAPLQGDTTRRQARSSHPQQQERCCPTPPRSTQPLSGWLELFLLPMGGGRSWS